MPQHGNDSHPGQNSLSASYLKLLAPAAQNFMESLPGDTPPGLSRDDIKLRAANAKENLYRIIHNYLGGDPGLYHLADAIADKGQDALKAVADRDDQYLAAHPQGRNFLEVLVRTDGSRPSFLIRNGRVDLESSPAGDWSELLVVSADALNEAIDSVGRIGIGEKLHGTGYLVHEDLVITNRHVLQGIASQDAAKNWQIKPGCYIDFGFEFMARGSVGRRELDSLVFTSSKFIDAYVKDHSRVDMALIRLKPSASGRRRALPLNRSSGWARENGIVFTIGYPGKAPAGTGNDTILEQLYKKTFGYKRLAPGRIMPPTSDGRDWTFTHDTTTLGGNSGSMVLGHGTEFAVSGLHYGGQWQPPRENWGHILGNLLPHIDPVAGKSIEQILQENNVKLVSAT
jgi:hypothetical protein